MMVLFCFTIMVIAMSILWWKDYKRDEIWRKRVYTGAQIIVIHGTKKDKHGWYTYVKECPTRISGVTATVVRIQNFGQMGKDMFLSRSYIDRKGRLYVRI